MATEYVSVTLRRANRDGDVDLGIIHTKILVKASKVDKVKSYTR